MSSNLIAQIYSEDFTGDNGQGLTGPTPPLSAVAGSGTAHLHDGVLDATTDWFRVEDGTIEARDTDGEVYWESDNISVSGIDEVTISIDYGEDGDHEAPDYIGVYYTLDVDNEVEVLGVSGNFCRNEDIQGPGTCTLLSFTSNPIDVSLANNMNIIIRIANNADDENINFDNLSVDENIAAPVSLISFTVKPTDANSVAINWSTESEENNEFFSIEYSTNGRDFIELERVLGAGTTVEAQQYHFMHKDVERGTNYYRLRQVDFDGTFSFSDIEVVVLKTQSEISIQPTLARNNILVSLNERSRNDGTIEIINWLGQVVFSENFSGDGDNIIVHVGDFESGHYIVRINTGNGIQSSRFVKI